MVKAAAFSEFCGCHTLPAAITGVFRPRVSIADVIEAGGLDGVGFGAFVPERCCRLGGVVSAAVASLPRDAVISGPAALHP